MRISGCGGSRNRIATDRRTVALQVSGRIEDPFLLNRTVAPSRDRLPALDWCGFPAVAVAETGPSPAVASSRVWDGRPQGNEAGAEGLLEDGPARQRRQEPRRDSCGAPARGLRVKLRIISYLINIRHFSF